MKNQYDIVPAIELENEKVHRYTDIPQDEFNSKELQIDDAISKTNFGLFNYLLIIVGGITMAAPVFEMCALAFILPVSECDLNLTSSQKGTLTGIQYIGIMCSSHLWGYLADTMGRRRIIQPTLFMAFVTDFIASFSSNFYFFVAMKFLNGFFISASISVIYPYISEFHNDKYRDRVLINAATVHSVLCILMPLVAWSVFRIKWQLYIPIIDIVYKSWRLYFIICSIPGLLVALILVFLPESPKYVLGQGKSAKAYEILQTVYRINNGKNSSLEPFVILKENESIENCEKIHEETSTSFASKIGSIWRQTVSLFKPPYLCSTILVCTIQFLIFITSTGFFIFFATILNKMAKQVDDTINQRIRICDVLNMHSSSSLGQNDRNCTTELEVETLGESVMFEVLLAVGFTLTGFLINKISKIQILIIILVGTGICGILCILTEIPILQIILFGMLLTCAICSKIVNAIIVEIYPTSLRATAVSVTVIMGRFGSAFGSNILAFLLENNCQAAFYMSGITLIVAGVLTFFIPSIQTNNKTDEKYFENCDKISINYDVGPKKASR